MKKIVMGIVAAACAVSMFAVDFSATVKMDTTIANKNGDNVDFLKVNEKDQKDGDALIISGSSDKAGAQFQLWYRFDGTDGTASGNPVVPTANAAIHVRNVNIWFKPVDQVKITVGNVAIDSYKEQIFWWHGVYGAKPGSWGAFGGEYIGTQAGVKGEFNVIDGFTFEAALFQGINTAMFSTADGYAYKGYAVKGKYGFDGGSATVVFADKGKDQDKIIALGADYSGIDNLYFFANLNLRINDGLQGLSVDNYFKYNADALTIQGHLPFVMFKGADDKMVPGMYATLKFLYAMDGFTPYLLCTTEPDGDAGWVFDDNFKFFMTFQPGVTFNVGSASFDAAFRLDFNDANEGSAKVNWKVPVGITCGL
jgi:hypothetical protein